MTQAAAIAAAAAAAVRKREEEEMTPYSPQDLSDNWQFKILQSPFGRFQNPEYLQYALDEEARAGWVLVEKFDNNRIRLKRPASAAQLDGKLDFDPFRTSVGAKSQGIGTAPALVLAILGAVLIAGLGLMFVVRSQRRPAEAMPAPARVITVEAPMPPHPPEPPR
jgi:hypothetical protein